MDTLYYFIILVIGAFLSKKNFIPKKIYPHIERLQFISLIILLLSMGAKMGMNETVISSFLTIGLHSILFALVAIFFSTLIIFIIKRLFIKKREVSVKEEKENKEKSSNFMSIVLVMIVFIGIIIGMNIDANYLWVTENIIQFGLYLLLFFTGIDMGRGQKSIFSEIKDMKALFIIIPASIVIGSLFGTYILGLILHYPMNEALSVGAGFGWYSLSSIIISPYSDKLAAIAFMSNVMREIISILIIPFIAKYIGYEEAIGPAGATAMDTLLPIVSRSTDAKTAVLSFTTGVILSSLVPILVPLMLNI